MRDREEDIAELRRMAREFAAGFNTGDVDRIMRFYDDTYVDVNLRRPVQTWEERRAYYAQVIRKGVRVDVQPDEVLVEGDLAFVRGSIDVKREGSPPIQLRYLELARRQPNGSWKVFWGMDGPIQEYDPAG